MNIISVKNASVNFPIYSYGSRSLKKSILNSATGGRVAKDSSSKITTVKALDFISFEAKDGDRIGLVGHNGSGKTTLLRMLAGVYEPTSGSVSVRGRVNSMLSISLGMDMDATGIENIYLRGSLMGFKPGSMRRYLEDIVHFADLGEFINFPMRVLSSGMQLRLAFAISTAIPSEVILLDEWLSVGDADFQAKAAVRLDGYLKRASVLVIASHNEAIIEQQCNRIFKLEHGTLMPY